MSPGTSVRSARSSSRRSRSRSTRRRGQATSRKRFRRRRRRTLALAATLGVGIVSGVLIANSDRFQDTLREVTLPLRHDDIIRQQAAAKDLPPELVAAVIYAESRFRDQESHAGARGLMQITPATAEFVEADSGGSTFETDDLSDPDINIRYGTYYLRYLLDKFDGNEIAALAAYNGGETNVANWGGSELDVDAIEFEETRSYVEEVLDKRDEYADNYASELAIE